VNAGPHPGWLVGQPGRKKNFPEGEFFRLETDRKVLLRHIYIFRIFPTVPT
jgi:hypothetical protein